MYIRRKVFSVLTDEMGEERLYSVNETLFEGYEYDEVDDRYFADHDAEVAGAAKGAAVGAGLVGAGYGVTKLPKAMLSKRMAKNEKMLEEVLAKEVGKTKAAKNAARQLKENLKASMSEKVANKKYQDAIKGLAERAKGSKAYQAALQKQKGAGFIEKGANKFTKVVSKYPKTATGVAAGLVAAPVIAGAVRGHYKKD